MCALVGSLAVIPSFFIEPMFGCRCPLYYRRLSLILGSRLTELLPKRALAVHVVLACGWLSFVINLLVVRYCDRQVTMVLVWRVHLPELFALSALLRPFSKLDLVQARGLTFALAIFFGND